jgi:hypothetical protein
MNQYQVKVLDKQTKIEDDANRALVELEQTIGDASSEQRKCQKLYDGSKALLDSRYQWAAFFNALQWAKPVDVWLFAIAGTAKPPEGAASESGSSKKKAGGDPKTLFGGGGGGGGGGGDDGEGEKDVDRAVKQLVARSVASNEVVDIFKAVGMDKPDISILSDEFLREVQKMPQKNVAVEVFRKLMKDAIVRHARTNLVQSRLFSEMLEETIRKYQNRTIEVAQVISELVKMAKERSIKIINIKIYPIYTKLRSNR